MGKLFYKIVNGDKEIFSTKETIINWIFIAIMVAFFTIDIVIGNKLTIGELGVVIGFALIYYQSNKYRKEYYRLKNKE
jgi:uncharacterized membrane protein YdbT with pleckstrin-like domain